MKRSLRLIAAAIATIVMPAVNASAGSVALPATGQNMCYSQTGTVINCNGTKQDGALRMGAAWPNPRFVDNANGTFTDNLTGLIWTKSRSCTSGPFQVALDYANTLADGQCDLTDGSVAGDWRVPNINELNSLFDLSTSTLAPGSLVGPSYYGQQLCSSTTFVKNIDNQLCKGDPGIGVCSKSYSCDYMLVRDVK